MSNHQQSQLVHFLQTDMEIPLDAIDLGLRRAEQTPNLLPVILWQYGLVTTAQLDQIFDWLENAPLSAPSQRPLP